MIIVTGFIIVLVLLSPLNVMFGLRGINSLGYSLILILNNGLFDLLACLGPPVWPHCVRLHVNSSLYYFMFGYRDFILVLAFIGSCEMRTS